MGKIDISRFSDTGTETPTSKFSYPDPTEVVARTAISKPEEKQETPLEQSYAKVWGVSGERVESINLTHLSHYRDTEGHSQPFNLNEDKVEQIMKSAEDIGIITPLIVRQTEGVKYQIIAGHHRYEAAKRLKLLTVPCIVRKLSDDEVFQIVAESNIQRSKILPSEYGRIFIAYMRKRKDEGLTMQEIADKFGESKKNMYRYINVAKLIPELQSYTDEGIIQIGSVDKICTFSENNQMTLADTIATTGKKKLTPAIAAKLAEIVENYGEDDVPMHEFSWLFISKPKAERKYKSNIYNNLSTRFNIDKSEEELDTLAERLLAEYFEAQNGGKEAE